MELLLHLVERDDDARHLDAEGLERPFLVRAAVLAAYGLLRELLAALPIPAFLEHGDGVVVGLVQYVDDHGVRAQPAAVAPDIAIPVLDLLPTLVALAEMYGLRPRGDDLVAHGAVVAVGRAAVHQRRAVSRALLACVGATREHGARACKHSG